MQDETKERWQVLCERAALEKNPAKFLDLIRELNEILEERDRQEKRSHNSSGEQLPQ